MRVYSSFSSDFAFDLVAPCPSPFCRSELRSHNMVTRRKLFSFWGVASTHRVACTPFISSFSVVGARFNSCSPFVPGEILACIPFQKVFVINLDRRKDRWESIYKQLTGVVGISPDLIERVSAVDGQRLLQPPHFSPSSLKISPEKSAANEKRQGKWNQEVLHRLVDAKLLSPLGRRRLEASRREQIWGMDLTPGAVGCALSHLEVWRRILSLEVLSKNRSQTPFWSKSDSGENFRSIFAPPLARNLYLVLEDDAVCSPSLLSDYHQRVTVPLSLDEKIQESLKSEDNEEKRNVNEQSLPFTPVLPAEVINWELLYLGGLDTGKECNDLSLARLFLHNIDERQIESHDPRTTCDRKRNCCQKVMKELYNSLSQICLVPALHRTTTAYAISAAGAAQLLHVCFPLTFQIDTEMTRSATSMNSTVERGKNEGEYLTKKSKNHADENHSVFKNCSSLSFVRTPSCLTLQPPLVSQCSEMDSDIQFPQKPIHPV